MAAVMDVVSSTSTKEPVEAPSEKANSSQEFSTDLLRVYYGASRLSGPPAANALLARRVDCTMDGIIGPLVPAALPFVLP